MFWIWLPSILKWNWLYKSLIYESQTTWRFFFTEALPDSTSCTALNRALVLTTSIQPPTSYCDWQELARCLNQWLASSNTNRAIFRSFMCLMCCIKICPELMQCCDCGGEASYNSYSEASAIPNLAIKTTRLLLSLRRFSLVAFLPFQLHQSSLRLGRLWAWKMFAVKHNSVAFCQKTLSFLCSCFLETSLMRILPFDIKYCLFRPRFLGDQRHCS